MSAHTPGPWHHAGGGVRAVDHGKWFRIGVFDSRKLTREGNEANARLAAAAPDLLAALESATAALRDLANGWPVRELHDTPQNILAAAESAIARATGVQP